MLFRIYNQSITQEESGSMMGGIINHTSIPISWGENTRRDEIKNKIIIFQFLPNLTKIISLFLFNQPICGGQEFSCFPINKIASNNPITVQYFYSNFNLISLSFCRPNAQALTKIPENLGYKNGGFSSSWYFSMVVRYWYTIACLFPQLLNEEKKYIKTTTEWQMG